MVAPPSRNVARNKNVSIFLCNMLRLIVFRRNARQKRIFSCLGLLTGIHEHYTT